MTIALISSQRAKYRTALATLRASNEVTTPYAAWHSLVKTVENLSHWLVANDPHWYDEHKL